MLIQKAEHTARIQEYSYSRKTRKNKKQCQGNTQR